MKIEIVKRFPLDGIIQITLDEVDYSDEYKKEYKYISENNMRGMRKNSLSPKRLQSLCGDDFLQKICIKITNSKIEEFCKDQFKDKDILPIRLIDFQTSDSKDFFHPGTIIIKYFYGVLATDEINNIDDKIKSICIDTMHVNDIDDKYLTDVLYDKILYDFFNMKLVNKVEYENDLLTLESLNNGNILRIFAKVNDSISFIGKSLYNYVKIDKAMICGLDFNIKSLTTLDKCLLLSTLNDGENVFKITSIHRIISNRYKDNRIINSNKDNEINKSKEKTDGKKYYELFKDKSLNIFDGLSETQQDKANCDLNEFIDYYNSINSELLNKINRNNLKSELLKIFDVKIPSEYMEMKINQFSSIYGTSDLEFYRVFLINSIKWETIKKALIKHYGIVIDDSDKEWTKKLIKLENTKLYMDIMQILHKCNNFPFLDRLDFSIKFLFDEIKLLNFLLNEKVNNNSKTFDVEDFYRYFYNIVKDN